MERQSRATWASLGLAMLVLLAVAALAASPASANSYVKNTWATVYPSSTLLATYNCTVCHTSAPDFNPYGQAISDEWARSGYAGSPATAIRAIEPLDSDGDTYSNLTEITANTLPGNATSHPAGDTTPPSAPGSLTASAASSSQIDLSWTASTDNVGVTGYRVYRGSTLIGSPTSTSYSDTGLSPSTAYSYTMKAIDGAGNLSAASNTASATTLAATDTTPPSAPSGLVAGAVSSSAINLSWTGSTDNVGVTGYRVYRDSTLVGSPTSTSYSDAGLSPSTTYSYTVKAADAAGNLSAASNTASATTLSTSDATPPTAPSGLTATAVSASQIDLTWSASADDVGVAGYRVYRDGSLVGSPTATSYSDLGLLASTTYSYVVKAVDAAANVSGASNTASATTLAATDAGALDAVCVSADIPTQIMRGRKVTVRITMQNTGTTPWTKADGFALVAQNPPDNEFWGKSRVELRDDDVIAPGETKTFVFQIKAPKKVGTYPCDWQMIQEVEAAEAADSEDNRAEAATDTENSEEQVIWFGQVSENTIQVTKTAPKRSGSDK